MTRPVGPRHPRGPTTTSFAGSPGARTVTVTDTVKTPDAPDEARTQRARFDVLGRLVATTDAHGTPEAVTTTYATTPTAT